jgi:DNA polymerase beta
MDYKELIIESLEILKKDEVINKNNWKARAYSIVIRNLEEFENPIYSIDDIKNIKGIGKSIKEKITEIIETGTLKKLDKIKEDQINIDDLIRIHGIGNVKAIELYTKYNIKTIADLEKHPEFLNNKQLLGLKYYKEFELKIPRTEMIKHETYIKSIIANYDSNIQFELVGSFRRGLPQSGDIDIIITSDTTSNNATNTIADIINLFKKDKYIIDDFAEGEHKYMGICKLKRHKHFRRIDILYATKDVWPYSLLYFTGNKDFNVKLRKLALSKGYSLNEYGLSDINTELTTEEEVLNFLGLKYIEPFERTSNIDLNQYKL